MEQHHSETVTGRVTDIFAHRFVVETPTGRRLADLGPKGAEQIVLRVGHKVELTGEPKPSELKVRRIVIDGRAFDVAHGKPHESRDPAFARQAVEAQGLKVVGEPRLKPKHAEVLGRDASGRLFEIHVEDDGNIRKQKPIADHDPRWASEIAA